VREADGFLSIRASPHPAKETEPKMTSLLSRLVRPRPKADRLAFTVYTRKECCCCHKALDLLRDRGAGTDSPSRRWTSTATRSWWRSTAVGAVVAIGGKVRFRGVVNPVLLDRLLLAESRGH
jgi:hypothetical protein